MCFQRKVKSEIKFWTFVLTCYTWNTVKTNWRMKYFFWYCLNTTVHKFNNSNIGTVNEIQKNLSIYTKWASKLKVHFLLKRYCSKFILNSVFICLQPSFLFQQGKKVWRHIFSSTCFCYYRKHLNNNNKIDPLPCSSWFQQHF